MRGYGGEKKGENYRNLVSRNEKNKSWERKIRSLYLQSESDEGERQRQRETFGSFIQQRSLQMREEKKKYRERRKDYTVDGREKTKRGKRGNYTHTRFEPHNFFAFHGDSFGWRADVVGFHSYLLILRRWREGARRIRFFHLQKKE